LYSPGAAVALDSAWLDGSCCPDWWTPALATAGKAKGGPVMLNSLQGPPGRTAFDVLMAGSVVSVLPMLLLFLLLQRHLVVGLTAGAVRE
jgi:sn-glycerol 3-phosphate transport system permease protein